MTDGRTLRSRIGDLTGVKRILTIVAALAASVAVTGCSDGSGRLPPVFGAVFGLEGAETAPFRVGKIEKPTVGPRDVVIGLAANSPGDCVFRRPDNRRFLSACPEGYSG